MSGRVDFNTCRLVSYGITNQTGFVSQGEMEVSVKLTPSGCSKLATVSNTTTSLCFTSTSGLNVYCLGDSGAPVYCQAPTNGEWILVGVTQVASSCGSSPEFRVIPYPG
uniref:Peptidase S1 domain-containing protein n=1 Tax=Biomphalaria glabrata TaxID=6526 RepID=A0A2C9KFM0_BIOGL